VSNRESNEKVRIDRWLWAARFFKTRSLAKTAIDSGKIEVNEQRAKASKEVALEDTLNIRRGEITQTIIVKNLSGKRGPAKLAQTLYEETDQSKLEREILAEKRKIARAGYSSPIGKPSKRDRRELSKLKQIDETQK
tara:strand:- start:524 stop:934 length:411 start_codon:yes stop_codon:yes gene_type:complete